MSNVVLICPNVSHEISSAGAQNPAFDLRDRVREYLEDIAWMEESRELPFSKLSSKQLIEGFLGEFNLSSPSNKIEFCGNSAIISTEKTQLEMVNILKSTTGDTGAFLDALTLSLQSKGISIGGLSVIESFDDTLVILTDQTGEETLLPLSHNGPSNIAPSGNKDIPSGFRPQLISGGRDMQEPEDS